MEVFDRWEEGHLVDQEGNRPGPIPKPPQTDITKADLERTIGLRNSEMMMLADEVLANRVKIKHSAKLTDGIMSVKDWSVQRKKMRIIMNEFMYQFKDHPLPSKKADYVEYSDDAWESLAAEKNFNNAVLLNIVRELEEDKLGAAWMSARGDGLRPSSEPAPVIFKVVVEKYTGQRVQAENDPTGIDYEVLVAEDMISALAQLPIRTPDSAPELFVIFAYNADGDSELILRNDIVELDKRMTWAESEEETDEDPDFVDGSSGLRAPAVIICDSASTVNVETIQAREKNQPEWVTHRTMYLPNAQRGIRRTNMCPRPLSYFTICYPRKSGKRNEFATFSAFTGIKSPLDPFWDDSSNKGTTDWSAGECSASYALLQHTVLPGLRMREKCRVINMWGGGNVTALALVKLPNILFCLCFCIFAVVFIFNRRIAD